MWDTRRVKGTNSGLFRRLHLILVILLLAISISPTTASSGCQVCATTGQCNLAFRNGPGKYCGNWYDIPSSSNKPCCCPYSSSCNVHQTQCMCHMDGNSVGDKDASSQHHFTGDHTEKQQPPSSFPIMIVILVAICFCMCCRNRAGHDSHSSGHVPVANAIPVNNESYSHQHYQDIPCENPAYTTGYGSSMSGKHPGGDGGGGAGAAIAAGLGGLAAGTLIGDLIGRNTAQFHNMEGSAGGNGGGGGYDIVGDSGDVGGGYDIAGDDGNDGYDIQGDS